jgi:hypothetical protein
VFSEVLSVSARGAEGPGNRESCVFIAQEFGRIGDRWSAHTTAVNVATSLKAFLQDFQTWHYISVL